MTQTNNGPEAAIAVFIDFENFALGFEHSRKKFEIQKVLDRLLEKGKIIVKRAYADWTRYRDYKTSLHEAAIELIEVPKRGAAGKNSADIRMVVDAIDMAHSKGHIDTFAILTGDSDFSPLVAKLKENQKWVIGCGVKSSTSDLLIGSCDEFIYYDDLIREVEQKKQKPVPVRKKSDPEGKEEDLGEKLLEAVRSLERDYDTVWGSMLKQTIRRLYPGFNEGYYGASSFAEILEMGEKLGMIEIEYDESRGNYIVRSKRAA